jgi:signal transduction histidine kinase
VAEAVRERAAELGLEFVQEVAADAGTLEADEKALRAMLVNLTENALDACRLDKAKARHRVALRASDGGSAVRFEVEDNGIGMEQETREKAFSLFFSSKGSEGTGLGLFVANKIATAHGGTIQIDSTLGVGTRFGVLIPRNRPGHPDPRTGEIAPGTH